MSGRDSPGEPGDATDHHVFDHGGRRAGSLRSQLDRSGFLVLEDVMSMELLEALRSGRVVELYEIEADRAGAEFKQEPGCLRLANLVDKGPVFERVIAEPRILAWVRHVIGEDLKLSSLNARTALPGCESQPLHVDMGAIPDEQGYWVCNTVWMLDDFTPDNGALRIIPGSHRWGQLPQGVMADPRGPHPDELLVTGRAGSVIIINAHVWHGGLANRTVTHRTALHAFYCRRDKPQQQHQRALLRAEVQDRMTPDLRMLLALDDPLNDALAQGAGPRSGFLGQNIPYGAPADEPKNRHKLKRVISGGQTGADQAAWRAARACGIPTGGWLPMGFRTEGQLGPDGELGPDESHSEFAERYGARAHESLEYRLRTRANVQMGEAVTWFGDPLSRDGRLTLPLAGIVGIPSCVVELGEDGRPTHPPEWLAEWLCDQKVETLMVAGNRESKAPGIGAWVEAYLVDVFRFLTPPM